MLAKILRITAIILLGLTVAFHILGGIGTSCVALGAEKYDSMTGLVSYKWLYQLFVLITLAFSVYGIWAMVALVKGKQNSYSNSLVFLFGILIVSGIHMGASLALRGKSAPTNMRVYLTLLTLVFFLILRIPAIWSQLQLNRRSDSGPTGAAGLAAILAGIMAYTVQIWAAPSHIMNTGVNYAAVWQDSLAAISIALVIFGVVMVIYSKRIIKFKNISPRVKLTS